MSRQRKELVVAGLVAASTVLLLLWSVPSSALGPETVKGGMSSPLGPGAGKPAPAGNLPAAPVQGVAPKGTLSPQVAAPPAPGKPVTPLTGLSEQPAPLRSLQESPPSKLIPPRPFTVNKETMDRLARTPLEVPNALTGQEQQALREIAGQIKAHDTRSATNGWSALLTTLNRGNIPVDVNALTQFVLRESYLQSNKDLKDHADKVKRLNEEKKQCRREMADLGSGIADLKRKQLERRPVGKPPQPPDPYAVQLAALTKSLRQLEERCSKLNDDGQLANIDLQNAMQRQQQALQMISNISKTLHDTAMAIIANIKG